ncbi:MAG TPA: hypothetical protein VFZ25_06100 [Chloroflexota bacterium]|nr:hypothetical protein [Chloroflexota bacterium]
MAKLNPFYLMASLYFVLDVAAIALVALVTAGIISPIAGLNWIQVHLLTIGVVTQAIFGTLPRLVVRARDDTLLRARITWATWFLVNGGFATLLVSMPAGQSSIAAGGALAIFSAVALMLVGLRTRGSGKLAVTRASLLFYLSGPVFFLIGISMALSMLLGWSAPGGFFGILEAHVHANVWGFLALVVAGVLIDRIPVSLGQPLRFPGVVPATAWLLIVGAIGLVVGPWAAILPLTILGISVYVVGTALLLANLIGTALTARGWTPNLTHLLVAYVWMVVPAVAAPLIVFVTGQLPTSHVEAAAVAGLVAGWILQIVIGAFVPGLVRGDHGAVTGNGSWLSVLALNLGVLLFWISPLFAERAVASVTAVGYTLIVVGLLPPLASLLRQVVASPVSVGHV